MTAATRLPPYSALQKVVNELRFLRFSVTEHPLRLFLKNQGVTDYVSSRELEKFKDRRVTILGWGIISRRVVTAKRESMKFLTLEDPDGIIEVVLFPEIYRRCGRLLQTRGPFQITGVVQSRVKGEANVIAEKIRVLEWTQETNRLRSGQTQSFGSQVKEAAGAF